MKIAKISLLLVLGLTLIIPGMLFAGGSAEGEETEQEDKVMRIGLRKLTTIDPALGANDPEVMFNRLQYDYLVEILPDGTLEPSLATGWQVSDDGLTYTFDLRSGVTFEDGSAFDAEDVVFTFERLVSEGSSIVGLMGQNEDGSATWSVEAADELTAVFTLENPNADFLYGVASRFAMILSSESEEINVFSEGEDTYEHFNGTGPFILEEYAVDQSARFVANPDYWGGAPNLDGIELVFFDDDQSQLDAFRSGALDFIIKVPDDLVPALEQVPNASVITVPTNTHPIVRVRTDEGSIGEDVRIRQAFKYATDRELLNLDALDGTGTVANNDPIGPTYGELYNPQDNQEHDPQRARELISEVLEDDAGNGYVVEVDGEARVEVPFYVGDTFEYGLVAEFLQQQWRESNIFVELNVVPENVYYAEGDNNWLNAQLGMTAWGARPTPQEYLSVAYTTGAAFNEARWSNEELDSLATEASRTADVDDRAEIYDEISEIFLESGPIIIPYFRPVVAAHSSDVVGLELHSFPGRTNFHLVDLR
ncbi:MAG: ABC transporter substrate-binding protein [Alkalispirochaetaceae bacterium]